MRDWDVTRIGVTVAACGLVFYAICRELPPTTPPLALHSASVSFQIDLSDKDPISPYIYGLAHASPQVVKDLNLGLNRWGGNANTRYNWEINAWNHARDWQWSNYGEKAPEARKPGASLDGFIRANWTACSYITMPTIGWVARDVEDSSRSLNVPATGGIGVTSSESGIAGYDPAANRKRTSIPSFPRKGRPFADPPDTSDNAIYQDEWVNHIKGLIPTKLSVGTHWVLAMDNEPDIWDVTHTDVHPGRMGYDDLLNRFLQYAEAAKDVAPSVQVAGPVSWGWTGYYHSPKDRDNFGARPDRRAHGDEPFIPWFLHSVRDHDQKARRRTLDILDIHYYPQAGGVFSPSTDHTVCAARIRSTRSLWDPTYKDESWIGEPVMLIPRMKEWIKKNYPDTRLGLMEWNWGGEDSMSGAIATAECLGIFGREGLDMAAYWTAPPVNSPAYLAFKIFRNVDGNNVGFGDYSARVTTTAASDVACFASSDHGKPAIILVNENPTAQTAVSLQIKGKAANGSVHIWQFGGENTKSIRKLGDVQMAGGQVKLTIPPYSITLLRTD
ncbi:MAG: glycoside hydrolase family 44 protein [Chthonomonadales bacterium]